MLTDALERMRDDSRSPEVDGDRCVHSICAEATCRACVDACPHGAWVVGEESLGIDTSVCDGCARCLPACPTGALWFTDPVRPARRRERGALLAFAACTKSGVSPSEGVIPCLHALGLGDLLGLTKAGIQRIVVAQGDCPTCPRAGEAATRFDAVLDTANRLLESRGATPLASVRLAAAGWQRRLIRDTDPEGGPTVGRRNFLRFAATKVVAEASLATAEPERPPFAPPGTRLPGAVDDREPLFPWVPSIDAESCTGCHACVRICPTGALTFASDPDRYHIDPAHCTGCRLCEDVCQVKAVSVATLAQQTQADLTLESSRCPACGTTFHAPQGRLPSGGLCRICGKTNHYKKLFQVLP